MINNQKIDVGDVEYSRLSHVLRFSVAANSDAISTAHIETVLISNSVADCCSHRDA